MRIFEEGDEYQWTDTAEAAIALLPNDVRTRRDNRLLSVIDDVYRYERGCLQFIGGYLKHGIEARDRARGISGPCFILRDGKGL